MAGGEGQRSKIACQNFATSARTRLAFGLEVKKYEIDIKYEIVHAVHVVHVVKCSQ